MSSTVINTNVMSLNSQYNLKRSDSALAQSLERLSSGLRINSAKDDAAGLSISDRMTAMIRGNAQAIRNANDGISMVQTAEGALSTITNDLQRMREIAVQSANDSNTALDRTTLNNEFQQLIRAIGRVANTTNFNTRNLLDGTLQSQIFQTGANQGNIIAATGVDARSTQLGAREIVGMNGITEAQLKRGVEQISGNFAINISHVGGVKLADNITLQINLANPIINTDAANFAGAGGIGATSEGTRAGTTGLTTLEDVTRVINNAIEKAIAGTERIVPPGTIDASNFAGQDIFDYNGAQEPVLSDARLKLAQANISAAIITQNDGTSTIILRGAFDSKFSINVHEAVQADLNPLFNQNPPDTPIIFFNNGGGGPNYQSEQVNITQTNVNTRYDAIRALNVVDGAINQISDLRSELGAVQKLFESAIDNLGIYNVNLSAARSRILDTDFAEETAALTRAQILQQAGISTLSQANASPQAILALLQ